jgi:3-hydroxyacyl-CoA dehydrogenase
MRETFTPDLPREESTASEINVLGFGVMGRQIAALLAHCGYGVHIWSRSFDAEKEKKFSADRKMIHRLIDEQDKHGQVHFHTSLAELKPIPTIEALCEDAEKKKLAIAQLQFSPEEIPCFSNSSSIPASHIGEYWNTLHFFNPLYHLRIIEYDLPQHGCHKPAQDALKGLKAPLIDRGFTFIKVQQNPGYLGNYLLFMHIAQVLTLIERFGYSSNQILEVAEKLHISVNVLDVIDLVGVDVSKTIIENLYKPLGNTPPTMLLDCALTEGILGKKSRTSFKRFIQEKYS